MRTVATHYESGYSIGLDEKHQSLILNDPRLKQAAVEAMKDGFPIVLWWDDESGTFRCAMVEVGDAPELLAVVERYTSTFGASPASPTRALRHALGYWWGGDEEWTALTGEEAS